ncbi:ABC transporter permease [Devosia sp. YIM 151766]|uniref:ABC transporter permease n=1 Tax=Devosia sp. YIM 151766 TaxID=3017325 RepID=UPI00255C4422|nr:ABC transporter permease [Devosia sp. YIM 151766]WIY52085.1 ABC transporter permease [Devosia sp. YIM 151766]
MLRYCLSRLGQLALLLVIASVLVFAVIQNAPGDPALMRLGLDAMPEQVEIERERLGLNRSLPERYLIWVTDALRLDLGVSFSSGLPVTRVLADALGHTLKLAGYASLIALILGTTLGIVAALNRGRRIDSIISAICSIGLSLPAFALGTILIVIFAITLRWLPPSGVGTSGQSFFSALRYLTLPAITLATPFTMILTRFMRGTLIEVMSQDYITTARAKGIPMNGVVIGHALRNALIPTVTVAGLQIGSLLAGATVTETVFSYPGIGRLTIEAVQGLDYPVVQAALLLTAALFLINTFIVDLLYGLIDPRIRTGDKK